MDTVMFFASGVEIALLAIAIGLSFVASILLRPKARGPIADREATTLASRGAYVPLILGRRRTGSVFAWAGDRLVKKSGGGGGKGGGGSSSKSTTYFEAGWHLICVGPATALHKIWVDGRVIFDMSIDANSHPSGSEITIPKEGIFRIYWGEQTQPINDFLADPTRVGVSSRWPLMCYIVWDRKNLGGAPRWPLIDYEIEVVPINTVLTPSPTIPASGIGTDPDDGMNPAAIIEHLLFNNFPHGLGLDREFWDEQSITDLGDLATTENLASSIAIRDGDEVDKLLALMMQDIGMFLPMDNGKMKFRPVREPQDNQKILSEDLLLPPKHEIETLLQELPVDSLIFTFLDRNLNYREGTVTIDEDGQASLVHTKRRRKIAITITVNQTTAAIISDRRGQEEVAGTKRYRLFADREARSLIPADVLLAHGISVNLRVVSVKPDPYSGHVEIEALADFYGALPTGFFPSMGVLGQPPLDAEPDPAVTFIDVPPNVPPIPPTTGLPGTPVQIIVPRIRAHGQIVAADVHISDDNVTYYFIGTEDGTHSGGTLDDDFPIGAFEIENGPIITAIGPDIADMLDLSPDEPSWRVGRQIAIIKQEAFFLRNLEAIGSDKYRLRGLIRARYMTIQTDHSMGDEVFIFEVQGIQRFTDPILIPGNTVFLKTQPFTSSRVVSLADVTAETLTIPQRIPFGPIGFRTERYGGKTNTYGGAADPQDFTLLWSYIALGAPRTGAGMQNAGEAVGFNPPAGTWRIEFLEDDAVTVVETVTVNGSSYLVDIATMQTWYGGILPDVFYARIHEIINVKESAKVTIQILAAG